MDISKKMAVAVISGACIVSSLLTLLADPTLRQLRRHGVYVAERLSSDGGRSLVFLVEANNVFMSMDFEQSQKKPSAYSVWDLGATRVTASDKDQNGRIDALTLNVTRDGIDYAYSDTHLEGDYSRMIKVRGKQILENMLKIDGRWLPVKPAGAKAIVPIDGKENLVDPHKSPAAIRSPVAPKPAAVTEKP